MHYLSVCSGIEAATVAWHPLGWIPLAFSEIESFPSKVLTYHYPNTPNLGDMTKFHEWSNYEPDLLVGGTPCQSFSIAGLRRGLDDPRGNLMLTFLGIADRYKPRWLLWENVPGVLSSNGGRDFGTFLGALGKIGYGFAYRVLDAQYCRTHEYAGAVPQRRRRVFVVGHLGDWRRAAAVLFDSESLRGNPPPSRKAREEVAGTISKCSFSGGAGGRVDGATQGHFQVANCLRAKANDPHRADTGNYIATVAPTLDAHYGDKMGLDNQHLNSGEAVRYLRCRCA
jgi:DNA (cytosine-5)-methyltransferase 1